MAWYEKAEDARLLQGDILPQCPLYLPMAGVESSPVVNDDGSMALSRRQATVVVMTQSCDLDIKNIQHVVVCAVYSVASFVMTDPDLRKKAEAAAKEQKVPWPSDEDADVEERVWDIIRKSNALRGIVKEFEKGRRPAYVLLHPCDIQPIMPLSLVSFRYVYMQPIQALVRHANSLASRVRLAAPYREYLAQAFGNYFSRVGLPVLPLSPYPEIKK
jgi:hypothetical protein